jgi:hypothetical protein
MVSSCSREVATTVALRIFHDGRPEFIANLTDYMPRATVVRCRSNAKGMSFRLHLSSATLAHQTILYDHFTLSVATGDTSGAIGPSVPDSDVLEGRWLAELDYLAQVR